jgi:hypothetical protein
MPRWISVNRHKQNVVALVKNLLRAIAVVEINI